MDDWRTIDEADKEIDQIVVAECDTTKARWVTIAEWDRHYESWMSRDDGLVNAVLYLPLDSIPTPPKEPEQ